MSTIEQKPFIRFTPAAIAHIYNIIKRRGSGVGLRLAVKTTGCNGYMYVPEIVDQSEPTDVVEKIDDQLSVFIDSGSLQFIQGTLVDYVGVELGQERLVFNNPNAVGECGCGESFNIKEPGEDHG